MVTDERTAVGEHRAIAPLLLFNGVPTCLILSQQLRYLAELNRVAALLISAGDREANLFDLTFNVSLCARDVIDATAFQLHDVFFVAISEDLTTDDA